MSNQQAASEHYEDEGHSVAGWIGVTLIMFGFALGAVGLFIESEVLVWIGVACVPAGAIIWPILKAMGLGPKEA